MGTYEDGADYSLIWGSWNASLLDPPAVGQVEGGGYFIIYRAFLYFDTSLLPAGSTILNASLDLYIRDYGGIDNEDAVVVQNGQPQYPHSSVLPSDYYYKRYSGNYGELSGADIVYDAYNSIPLNASILTEGGTTKLCLRTQYDIDAVEATGTEFIDIGSYNYLLEPRLFVRYISGCQISITTSLSEGWISVDGVRVGNGSATVGVSPGLHTVSFSRIADYRSVPQQTQVLDLGDSWSVTGTYVALDPLGVVNIIGTALIVGVLGFLGYNLGDAVDLPLLGIGIGIIMGLIYATVLEYFPVWTLLLISMALAGIIYMKWFR